MAPAQVNTAYTVSQSCCKIPRNFELLLQIKSHTSSWVRGKLMFWFFSRFINIFYLSHERRLWRWSWESLLLSIYPFGFASLSSWACSSSKVGKNRICDQRFRSQLEIRLQEKFHFPTLPGTYYLTYPAIGGVGRVTWAKMWIKMWFIGVSRCGWPRWT